MTRPTARFLQLHKSAHQLPLYSPLCRLTSLLGVLLACAWPSAEGQAQTVTNTEAASSLRRYYVPDTLPASFVFDLDSGRARQIWRQTGNDHQLVTELFDERYRMQEYRRERLDERGAFLDSYATYWRDSSGQSIPLFVELGSPDLFFWDWPEELIATLSYREPRKMDTRMAGIRIDRERSLLPDLDTVLWRGQRLPVRFTNDVVRLAFFDRKGESLGEDFYLEFSTWGEGLGLLHYVRRFGDGTLVSGDRLPGKARE